MSDNELKDLLKKNVEMSERTLQLVQKMHRATLWARFFSLLKWAVIIGAAVWSYQAIQPFLQKALGISQQIGDLQKSLPSDGGLEGILKNFIK